MTMAIVRDPVNERTTVRIATTITDENQVAIPGTSLTTLVLTLYARDAAKTIINSRNKQNVLNSNGCTIDANGNLVMILTPLDGIIVDVTASPPPASIEEHVLLFEGTFAAGAKAFVKEILLKVKNVEKVP